MAFSDGEQSFLKLLCQASCAVVYIENNDQTALNVKLQLDLTNLALVDEPEGTKELNLTVQPGQKIAKILKSVNPAEGTGISFGAEYIFD